MFVKICGITREEDIEDAVLLGYSAVGVVLHAASPRYVLPERARSLARYAAGRISTVAVGVSWAEVNSVEGEFDFVQTFDPCPARRHILAGTRPWLSGSHEIYLYDRSAGKGRFETLPPFRPEILSRIVIAGGLKTENVGGVIRKYRPFGVDVSSGVERTRGRKDSELMRTFIEEVRNARC